MFVGDLAMRLVLRVPTCGALRSAPPLSHLLNDALNGGSVSLMPCFAATDNRRRDDEPVSLFRLEEAMVDSFASNRTRAVQARHPY